MSDPGKGYGLLMVVMIGLQLGTCYLLVRQNPNVTQQDTSSLSMSLDNYIVPLERRSNAYQTPYEMHHVRNTLTKYDPKIKTCYDKYVEQAPQETDGKIFIEWMIGTEGQVYRAEVVQSSYANTQLEECIVTSLRSWNFPPPPSGRPVYTSYTYHFKNNE